MIKIQKEDLQVLLEKSYRVTRLVSDQFRRYRCWCWSVEAAPEEPSKQLDDLFNKTKSTPSIYWLPLSEEASLERDAERERRREERAQKRKEAAEKEKKEMEKMREERMQARRDAEK